MLTDPQRDFVGTYLLDCDARLAAIRSGYDLQPCTNSPKRSYKAIGLARLTNANSYPCTSAYREKVADRQAEAARLRSLQLLTNFVHAARLLHEGLPPNDARRQFLKDTVKYTVNWEPQEAINHAAA